MSDIRIKVGVALDANASAVLAPVEQAVRRTQRTVKTEMAAAGKAMADETAKGSKKVQNAFAEIGRVVAREEKRKQDIIRKSSEMAGRFAAQQAKEEATAARKAANDQIREAQRSARERIRLEKAAARELERARKLEEKTRPGFFFKERGGAIGIGRRAGLRVSRGAAIAYGYGGEALSTAAGIGLDFAHGLGYDTDIQSHVRHAQEQRTLATKISSSGFVPGTSLVSPEEIISKAREVGNATGTDTTEALDALGDFVGKTGELKTGLDSLQNMAVLSKATGTNLADMANASAEVANALGDVPDKANVVNTIMKQVSGQGKLGAVEIRDMAVQMAKLGASAARFKGGAAENISTLGVIAQEAKLRGGAASASQAATSVMAFASGFSTKATFKNWATFRAPVEGKPGKFEGINPYTDKSHSELSDPMTLIKSALSATRGDQTKLATLFPSKQGFRAVAGFASIYNQAAGAAGGTADQKNTAGLAAVQAEFDRLKSAMLDNEEVHRAFTASMQTSESKATIFNNKMTAVADELTGALLPAIGPAGDALVEFASDAAKATTWIADFLSGHNAAQDKQSGDAYNAAIANTDAHDRAAAGTIDPKTGKRVVTDEAKALEEDDQKKRQALVDKQKAQVAAERAQAKSAQEESQSFVNGGTTGFKALWRTVTGQKSAGDEATEMNARADRDQSVLDVLQGKQDRTNQILLDIQHGIDAQTTVIKSTKPPKRPEPGARPEADTQ